MAIPQKLLGGFFCQRLSVLIADISPLNIQDECTGSLFALVIFFFPTPQISMKRGEIIFILEVLKAVSLKCFSLHTTTKKW